MIEATGWTFREVDALEVEELMELTTAWQTRPPLPVVVRAWAGVKGEAAEAAQPLAPPIAREWTPEEVERAQAATRSMADQINAAARGYSR